MFRRITDQMLVSEQIDVPSVAVAAAHGVTLIVNNRPEDEAPDQTAGAEIEAAAKAAGIGYIAIPVTHSGFSQPQVAAMAEALENAQGDVLAYCRSGSRSAHLWALAECAAGGDPDSLINMAAKAGFDISAIRPLMDMVRAQA